MLIRRQVGLMELELSLIADLVAQHCHCEDEVYDSGCISANADAIRYLCEKGWMEMVQDGPGTNCRAIFRLNGFIDRNPDLLRKK
jgi:hypothetical protein